MSFSFEKLARKAVGEPIANLPVLIPQNNIVPPSHESATTPEEIQRLILGEYDRNRIDARVSDLKALSVAAVYACVNVLANSVAMLSVKLYKKVGNTDVADLKSPVGVILASNPAPRLTPFLFWRMVMAHICLRGNFYAQKVVVGGRVVSLLPLNPDRTEPRSPDGVTVIYVYRKPDGSTITFSDDEIFHLTSLSLDGIKGLSVLQAARRAINVSSSAEDFAGALFTNSAKPAGYLKHPALLNAEAVDRLRQQFDETYAGSHNAGKTMLLEEGMEFQQMQLTAEDSQFMESRSFQRGEICMFFGVPPQLVGDVDKGTSWGTGIETQNLAFLTHTLRPYLINIQQYVVRSLLAPGDQPNYCVKFDTSELTKADFASRQTGYQVQRRNGVINADEWRQFEGQDPIADGSGKVYLIDQTLIEKPLPGGAAASADDVPPYGTPDTSTR